ncbi:MAG: hypothetical protein ACRDV4_07500 [Acidimicrobiales bacterium]
MKYERPTVEHRERIDEPLVLGLSTAAPSSPAWKDEEDSEKAD